MLLSPCRPTTGLNQQPHNTMLIMAKNKVDFEQLKAVQTPAGTDSFTPIPHAHLAALSRVAIERAGLTIEAEEHALARGGLRYFGGFALRGADITGDDRKLVFGLRNSGDKSFAASVCIGTSMLVCDNLHFSANIKLARRHTTNILADLPRVLADAVGRCVSQWNDMGARIKSYQETEITKQHAADLLVDLVDAKALPARDIYNVMEEFRNPRHAEFKGGTMWTLFNAYTEKMKGSDLTKLPYRTMAAESILDRISGFKVQEVDAVVLAN